METEPEGNIEEEIDVTPGRRKVLKERKIARKDESTDPEVKSYTGETDDKPKGKIERKETGEETVEEHGDITLKSDGTSSVT